MLGLSALLALTAGCGKLRGLEGEPVCQEYDTTIQPLLTQRCVSCHGADRAEGGYKLTSRLEALARRDDGSTRVVGADAGVDALVLAAAKGELPGHEALAAGELATLTSWVVDCKAGGRRLLYHPRGWSTPTSTNFHGDALRETGYQIDGGTENCMGCHGDNLKGGKAKVSCHECHSDPLFSCTMCHGSSTNSAPPRSLSGSKLTATPGVGAHQTHVQNGPLHLAYGCDRCHVTPVDPFQSGHFQVDGGPEDGRAEVVFAFDGGRGQYSFDQHACTNSTCHAPEGIDTAAKNQLPTWTKVGQGEAACGTCHGAPPSSHSAETDCGLCHQGAFVDGGVVVAKHADGHLNLGRPGDPTVTCASCHGDSVAFRDLHGRTDPSVVTVGAHQAHLQPKYGFSGPVQCNQCHLTPTEIRSPGHIDHLLPATVFPSGVADGGSIAANDGATPTWNRATATCGNVYCHMLGNPGARDTTPNKLAQVRWTTSAPQAFCGSCHGVPPNTPIHGLAKTLSDCHGCHASTIASAGNFVVSQTSDGGVTWAHINGVVDVVYPSAP